MSCDNCNTCITVTDDCLCQYVPLKHIKQADYPELVDATHFYIEAFTGDCDFCENIQETSYEYAEIIADRNYKRLYAHVFYMFWLEHYGDGKPTATGLTTSTGDDYSDFVVQGKSNVQFRIKNVQKLIEDRLLPKFKELMTESGCIECEEQTVLPCGCSKGCCCGRSKYYQIDLGYNETAI